MFIASGDIKAFCHCEPEPSKFFTKYTYRTKHNTQNVQSKTQNFAMPNIRHSAKNSNSNWGEKREKFIFQLGFVSENSFRKTQ